MHFVYPRAVYALSSLLSFAAVICATQQKVVAIEKVAIQKLEATQDGNVIIITSVPIDKFRCGDSVQPNGIPVKYVDLYDTILPSSLPPFIIRSSADKGRVRLVIANSKKVFINNSDCFKSNSIKDLKQNLVSQKSCLPDYLVVDPRTKRPIEGVDATLVYDYRKEDNQRTVIKGSTDQSGKIIWKKQPTPTDESFILIGLVKEKYAKRNWHTSANCKVQASSATALNISLWSEMDLGVCLKTKNYYLDPGHAIAYATDKTDAIRVQEWYLADRVLQGTKKILNSWGTPLNNIYESRTAGILFNEKYWSIHFGDSKANSPITIKLKGPKFQPIDELVNVLSLDNEKLRDDFSNLNKKFLNDIAKKKNGGTGFAWSMDNSKPILISVGAVAKEKVKKISTNPRLLANPDQTFVIDRAIIEHLVESRLAEETINSCLRHTTDDRGRDCAELTLPSEIDDPNSDPAFKRIKGLIDHQYIKQRMLEQIRQPWAFDCMPPLPARFSRSKIGSMNPNLLGWTVECRQNHWDSLRLKFEKNKGIIVSLHFNAGGESETARGAMVVYNDPTAQPTAKIFVKYADWLRNKLYPKGDPITHGFVKKTKGQISGATFFSRYPALDVFIEDDFYDTLMKDGKYQWEVMVQPKMTNLLGHLLAEAIAESLCYPQTEGIPDDVPQKSNKKVTT